MRERGGRRHFTAEYKRRILHEVDACSVPGEISALLRREGLYSSHVVAWRRARERGELAALEPKKRGPRPRAASPARELAARDREIARLKAENARLQLRCDRYMKRIASLLVQLRAAVKNRG
jgi:transposase-like protein